MKYASIKTTDVTNGTGIRITIFVSGCHLHCKGCFNPQAQDFSYGNEFTQDTLDEILKQAKNDYIAGISLLGGEPFSVENIKTVYNICYQFKLLYPNKTIFCWSGYTIDELIARNNKATNETLKLLDVLVDGRFVLGQRDLRLKWRGSRNQRVLYKKDLKQYLMT